MKKRKVKKTFLIPLFIGLALVVTGIIMTVTFSLKGSHGAIFIGPLAFGVGGFIATFGTIIVFASTNSKKPEENIAYNTFFDGVKDLTQKIKKINEKECKYCGATLKADETKCPNCGAKDID